MSFSTEQPPNWMEEAQKSGLARVVDSFEERQLAAESTLEALQQVVALTLAALVEEIERIEGEENG